MGFLARNWAGVCLPADKRPLGEGAVQSRLSSVQREPPWAGGTWKCALVSLLSVWDRVLVSPPSPGQVLSPPPGRPGW